MYQVDYVNKNSIGGMLEKLKQYHPLTYYHSKRVAELSVKIGKRLNISGNKLKNLYTGAVLHDLGKLVVSTDILDKNGKLTNEEWMEIKKHPIEGYKLVHVLGSNDVIPRIILLHHERCNGNGYPFGLCASDIPVKAQIVAVADSFDAMTQARPYNQPDSPDVAAQKILEGKYDLYDPMVVDAFMEVYRGM